MGKQESNTKKEAPVYDHKLAVLCRTNKGNGLKFVADGTWYYISKASFESFRDGTFKTARFRTRTDEVSA